MLLPSAGGAAEMAATGSVQTARVTPSQAGLRLLSSQPVNLPCAGGQPYHDLTLRGGLTLTLAQHPCQRPCPAGALCRRACGGRRGALVESHPKVRAAHARGTAGHAAAGCAAWGPPQASRCCAGVTAGCVVRVPGARARAACLHSEAVVLRAEGDAEAGHRDHHQARVHGVDGHLHQDGTWLARL